MHRVKASKWFGVFIMGVVIMTALSSCKQQSDFEKEIIHIELEEQFNDLTEPMSSLAELLEKENGYFTDNSFDESYDAFVQSLDPNFEQVESDFSSIHKELIGQLATLKVKFEKDAKALEQIAVYDTYQQSLGQLFNILMQYHYSILESKVIQSSFETVMAELITDLTDGSITSNEYNSSLQSILDQNEDLLNIDGLSVMQQTSALSSSEMKEIIERIISVKEKINQIDVSTEADRSANDKLYLMFDLVEKSLMVYSDFSYLLEQSLDLEQMTSSLENEPVDFTQEVLEKLTKPDFRDIF